MSSKPKIAILCWERGTVPAGLMQMEEQLGNSTNLKTYPFPVKLVEIKGANVETVITHPSAEVLERMIAVSKRLIEEDGIQAISTSCGFNAIFQEKLSSALSVPVFTSALLQVPFVHQIVGANRGIGIITANKSALSTQHLTACGITQAMKVFIFGLEEAKEWGKIFEQPDVPFDIDAVGKEIVGVAEQALLDRPEIGAFVLECTDLPPYAERIRSKLKLPVFDFCSMMELIAAAVGERSLY